MAIKKVNGSEWHKKIAKNRGERWHKNMLEGRRLALLHPSKIRLTRLARNLDQSDLASKLQMSESTFGAIERGRRLVKKDVAQEIAKILVQPANVLFKPQGKNKFVAVITK